ncbi:DUF5391 family protein [Rummeliibacillus sp. NPDC094406]|uniref:DUF5391 family protein n=1 Tax=Rummeliibacillus sp. NPDC094406 TaxID=3364511 RepID=UPI0037FA7E61
MTNKKSISVVTIISAILFCTIIIAGSLSPLSELGENANKFNSQGMWESIGSILLFYAIPLFLYLTGLDWIIYIMTFLCAFGIIIFAFVLFIALVIGNSINYSIPALVNVLVVCSLAIIVNVIWFFVAFRKERIPSLKPQA